VIEKITQNLFSTRIDSTVLQIPNGISLADSQSESETTFFVSAEIKNEYSVFSEFRPKPKTKTSEKIYKILNIIIYISYVT